MAVVVKLAEPLVVNSPKQVLDYLYALYNQPTVPFGGKGAQVNITNREGMPADTGMYDVAIQMLAPLELKFDSLLVLMADGNYTVITIPRGRVVSRH